MLNILISSIKTGIFLIDEKTHEIVEANNAALTLTGFSKEEVIGHICHKFICPSEIGRCPVSDLGQTIDDSECTLLNRYGKEIMIAKSVVPVSLDGQKYLFENFTDITKYKKIENELRTTHQQFLDIINFLPDATFVINSERKIVAWNRAIEKMTGFPKDKMLGKGNYAYAEPFYGKKRPILIDLLFETDIELEKKYDFVHKVGNTYYVEVFIPEMYRGKGAYLWASASKLFDSKGDIVGAIESVRDVTDWKRAQQQIQESEEKYRGIFENAVEGIFQTTPDGRFISINPALAIMMGFDFPEHMMKTFTDIAKHHYVNPSERMKYRRLLESNGFIKGFETQVYKKNGDKIWISISSRAIYDKNGALDHYEGTIIDITSRKDAETAFRNAYQTFRSIIENAPFGIYIVNEEGFIEYANQPMISLSGTSKEQLMLINTLELPIHEKLGLSEKISSTLKGIPFSMGPVEYTSHFGNKKTVRNYVGIPFEEAGKKKAIIFVEDLTELKRAEELLHKERETFFLILENSPEGIMLIGKQGKFDYINPEFTRITGYTIEDIPDGRHWFKKAYPDPAYRELVLNEWKRDSLLKTKGKTVEFKVTCKNGNIKDIRFKTTYLRDGTAIIMIEDVTGLREAERARIESEERFRSLFESSRDAIYFATGNGKFIDINQAFIELFGSTKEETLKKNAKAAYLTANDRIKLKNAIKKNNFVRDFEMKLKKTNGVVMDCLLTISSKKDEHGKIIQYQGIVRDITEKKRTDDAIKYMAFHDALTGLPNRSLFNDRLAMSIAHAERFDEKVAVMMLDLDKFKFINDTYGHSVGDLLLKAVAKKLTKQIRKGDTVARLGGDEFMLIFADLKQTDDVNVITEKIIEDFQPPVKINGYTLSITTSIGIAIYPNHGTDSETLIRNADIAMYIVKQTGRNGYKYYDPESSPTTE